MEQDSGTRMRGMPRHTLSSRSESRAATRCDCSCSLRDVEAEARSEQEDARSEQEDARSGDSGEGRREEARAERKKDWTWGGETGQRRARRGQDAPLLRHRGATGRCEEQGGSGREEWRRAPRGSEGGEEGRLDLGGEAGQKRVRRGQRHTFKLLTGNIRGPAHNAGSQPFGVRPVLLLSEFL